MNRPRLLIADDHAVMLEGITATLETQFEIVGTFQDGRSLVNDALRLKPEAIVLDISMPMLNGLDATRQIKCVLPDVKVLCFTMHSEQAYLASAVKAGVNGYVLKSASAMELSFALQQVLKGRSYIPPALRDNSEPPPSQSANVTPFALSAREREVLQLIAEGRSAKEIAFLLSISVRTTRFHRENIKTKLRLFTTAQLTKYAIEQCLV